MQLPRNFSDEAFILRRTNYSESDRLLVIFTKNHGKLFAMAKGARKSVSKKAAHIELFTHTRLHFAASPKYVIVTQAETINDFLILKTDLAPVRAAFHLNEIIDQLLPEGEPFPKIFKAFVSLFKSLNEVNQTQGKRQRLITNFQLYILDLLGFGHPPTVNTTSVYAHIEEVIDRRLKAAKSLL